MLKARISTRGQLSGLDRPADIHATFFARLSFNGYATRPDSHRNLSSKQRIARERTVQVGA